MPDEEEFDKLLEEDLRVRKASRMVPIEGPLSDQKRHEIRQALDVFMEEHGLSQDDVARGTGYSKTYISNLLTKAASLPAATRDQMLRDINNWLDREARARENRRPDDFVLTRVAERYFALANRLTERADTAVAYGPAGIGKTKVTEAILAEIPTAVGVRVDHDSRYPSGLLRKIYNALSRAKKQRNPVRLAEVVEKLRKPPRIATHNLLIVDQAQCSVLLVGTIDLKDRVATDDEDELGQISSRVGLRVNLAPELAGSFTGAAGRSRACFTVSDIRKLFRRSKLKLHPDAVRLLCEIANRQRGTLRRVCRLFDWAEVAARKAHSEEITVTHIETAGHIVEKEIEITTRPAEGQAAEATA